MIEDNNQVCDCGNPEFGFDCVCQFVKDNPGNKEFTCNFCGIYAASKPRCSECIETTDE